MQGARNVLRQAVTSTTLFSFALAAIGVAISGVLPEWLGGDVSIHHDAASRHIVSVRFLRNVGGEGVGESGFEHSGRTDLQGAGSQSAGESEGQSAGDFLLSERTVFPEEPEHQRGDQLFQSGCEWHQSVGVVLLSLLSALDGAR